ncbi:ferritin [Clostridium swellfunianum]|uniref:ferritin n=1 Tax=Clostridium swellfunianum TaxID=1367462 RepID=UPI00202E80F0|nr:ferritin [Clostridium swellfunianum]MCM0649194.1 ferritin [Clostridium swellfunianum]
MLSEKLVELINKQINYEFFSEHVYLAMAAYCADEDLDGFANFFRIQAEEERFHAMKLFDYVVEMNQRVIIKNSPEPRNDYESVLQAFKAGLEHEKSNTKNIYSIADVAMEERNHATISFLKWFIDEQVEEEALMNSIIKKLERIGNDSAALYMLDTELATRAFTPPIDTTA